ncbi:MAG: DUF5317 domain-containing protein [Actinomycetota bacterium]|nr:DUF5317 domain-containing protein [Actinomycetota bacterium]
MSLSLAVVLAASLAFGLWRGGSLHALAETRVRWLVLLFEGLAVQVIFDVWDPPGLTSAGALAVLLVSNLAVGTFALLNFRLAGMLLVGLGLVLNSIVIAANQAMPVSPSASTAAGVDPPTAGSDDLKHERLDEDTKLGWLADVIPVPGLREVLSLGDLVLALGIGRLVYIQTTSQRRRARATEASG